MTCGKSVVGQWEGPMGNMKGMETCRWADGRQDDKWERRCGVREDDVTTQQEKAGRCSPKGDPASPAPPWSPMSVTHQVDTYRQGLQLVWRDLKSRFRGDCKLQRRAEGGCYQRTRLAGASGCNIYKGAGPWGGNTGVGELAVNPLPVGPRIRAGGTA